MNENTINLINKLTALIGESTISVIKYYTKWKIWSSIICGLVGFILPFLV